MTRLRWLGLAVAMVLLGVIVVKIKTKDWKETEVTINVPGEVESVTARVQKEKKTKPATRGPRVATEASPFDALDPAAIPAAERFEWQPKELVAVLGSHRQRLWAQGYSVALSGDGAWAVATGNDGGLLLDVATGTTAGPTEGLGSRNVAMSPDGLMFFWVWNDRVYLQVKQDEVWTTRPLPVRGRVDDTNPPRDAHFSTNGAWLTTSVLHERVENEGRFSTFVWDVSVDPPKRVIDLKGYKHPSLSADGQRLAVIDTQDASLHVFDVSSLPPKPLLKLPGVTITIDPRDPRPRHGFLGDGTLAVLDTATRLGVWDVSAVEPKLIAERDVSKQFDGSGGLRPFRTGEPRFLLPGQVVFQSWRVEKGTIVPEFTGPPPSTTGYLSNAHIHDVAISLDGRTIASTHLSGMVKLYEVTDEGIRERHPIRQQPASTDSLGSRVLHVSPDGRHLATRAENGTQVWRLGGPVCQQLTVRETDLLNVARMPAVFVDDGQFLAAHGGSVLRARIEGDRLSSQPLLNDQLPSVAAATPHGLLLSLQQGTPTGMALWQIEANLAKPLCEWPAAPPGRLVTNNGFGLSALFAITPDGRTLVTTDSAPGTPTIIRIWHRGDNAAPPVEAASFSVPSDDPLIWQLTITPDGQRIAVAARSGLSLWSLQDDKPTQLWHKPGDCHSVAFSPDGRQLAASGRFSDRRQVALFNNAGERQTGWEFPMMPADLAFAPDGRHLLTANTNGTVYILRLKDAAKPSQAVK